MSRPNIYEILTNALGIPVYLQGSYPENLPYPDLFATYYWYDTEDLEYMNNRPTRVQWFLQVCVYGISPAAIAQKSAIVLTELESNGLWRESKGRAIPSDEPTHNAWEIDFIFLEEE